jgi:ribonucleoside-diphosphate reductase alpha chain
MSSYNNFQSDNAKHSSLESRNNYNPEFNSSVEAKGKEEFSQLRSNLDKYVDFVSWARWYPDLWLDLIKPKNGGIKLHSDQRTFMRVAMRFLSMYGVYPRGWGKTFNEEITMFIACVFFPSIEFSLTAQTKENAAELLKDKYNDILKKYPWFKNEIFDSKFSKNDAEIKFVNGSRIDVLANSSTSKGQRRNVIMIEESALIDDFTFQDSLFPIVEHGRLTVGKLGILNPEELSQKVNFYTTAGFRGSDEFNRSIRMIDDMINLQGKIVIGSDWHLGCWYGRGSTKQQILDKKKNMSPIAFAQNYESKWVGSVDGALVDINKLINLRTLSEAKIKANSDEEFYLGVDVARSLDTSNNQSSVAVVQVIRDKKGNLFNI